MAQAAETKGDGSSIKEDKKLAK